MPSGAEVQDETQHGGKRTGAGRPRGSVNRRTSALRDAVDAEGVDPAVALVRIGKAAEEREEYSLAVEAYGKVLPFLHAKPRTAADAHPEEALDFVAAMLKAKLFAAAAVLDNPSLADRLARAKARIVLSDDGAPGAVGLSFGTGFIQHGPADTSLGEGPIIDATPSSPAGPSPRPLAEPPAPEAPRYVPILPTADPAPRTATDWSAPVPWSQQQAFADGRSSFETDPYEDDPLGLLAGRS